MIVPIFLHDRLCRFFGAGVKALGVLCWLSQCAVPAVAQRAPMQAPDSLSALPWQGIVRHVTDGDTFWIAPRLSPSASDAIAIAPNLPIRYARSAQAIRIAHIDAPERGQFYAESARQLLQQLCLGQVAEVSPLTRDRYQRTVAHVKCAGINVAAAMVDSGAAWVYRRYTRASDLIALEQGARAAARGLWQQSAQKNPEAFRRTQAK